uniref:Uncharacterized protein n=1 Tax=Anguilla anguilla TaxID=7936 RepID=A0A0E9S2K9_ANGAN
MWLPFPVELNEIVDVVFNTSTFSMLNLT